MEINKDYASMSLEELVQTCEKKDTMIEKKDSMIDRCMNSLRISECAMLTKEDIMSVFKCENNKALRILKLLFQMGFGNKIGKEYYVSKKSLNKFTENMAGKEVFI